MSYFWRSHFSRIRKTSQPTLTLNRSMNVCRDASECFTINAVGSKSQVVENIRIDWSPTVRSRYTFHYTIGAGSTCKTIHFQSATLKTKSKTMDELEDGKCIQVPLAETTIPPDPISWAVIIPYVPVTRDHSWHIHTKDMITCTCASLCWSDSAWLMFCLNYILLCVS